VESTATNDELQLVNSREKLIVDGVACCFKKLQKIILRCGLLVMLWSYALL